MQQVLIFSLAAVLGSGLRYALMTALESRHFPWGTLTVNIVGSFLIGLCLVLFEKGVLPAELKLGVMTAFLGAFTTFSAFSLDAFRLLEAGHWLSAFSYILGSVGLCILAVAVSVWTTRALI